MSSKKRRGLGRTAAAGLAFDPELRRAAVRAAPPVARLGYILAKRMASQQLDEATDTFSHLVALLTSDPPRRRRLLPAAGAVAVVAVAVVVATDPDRRRRLQRLVVH